MIITVRGGFEKITFIRLRCTRNIAVGPIDDLHQICQIQSIHRIKYIEHLLIRVTGKGLKKKKYILNTFFYFF
jgi:hypothetical protein